MPSDTALALISSDDATRPTVGVVLNGTGLVGKLTAPAAFTMTSQVGITLPATLTIKNTGKGPLSGDWAPVSIPPYQVGSGHFDLQPGATQSIQINFTPTRQRQCSLGGIADRGQRARRENHRHNLEGSG